MTTVFFGFVALMTFVVLGLVARYLGGRTTWGLAAGLLGWFLYVGGIGYFGLIRNVAMRPPGPAFLFVPIVVILGFSIYWVRTAGGAKVASSFPLWVLIGTQVFRVAVELILHELWRSGLIPKMLTYSGANVDIYVGASAPLVAWLSTRNRSGLTVAFIWNLLGLAALANVVSRAILTSPGPLQFISSEVPNLMIGTFPYMFIPGFFVVLAVLLHILALRAIGLARRDH